MSPTRRRPARPAPLEPNEDSRPAGGGTAAGERSAGSSRGSFGQWLRGQREARGVELAEIAESSKISLRYLEALEQDRFEVLPAPVFVRGFLREYSRVVGLDADEVVNLFLVSAPRVTAERRPESSVANYAPARIPRSYGRGLLAAALVLLILGAAAALAFWAAHRFGAPARGAGRPADSTAAAAAHETPSLSPTPAQAAPPAEPPPIPASPAPVESTAPPATTPVPAPAPTSASPGAAQPGAPSPLIVVLAFQQDCWVETRVDGGRRSSELRAGGETLTLEAKESIILTLGNAPAVRAELNGRPLALPADATRLLRDFRIDRSLVAAPSDPDRPQPLGP